MDSISKRLKFGSGPVLDQSHGHTELGAGGLIQATWGDTTFHDRTSFSRILAQTSAWTPLSILGWVSSIESRSWK